MSEGFRIQFIKGGKPLSLALSKNRDGLVIDGEKDASPRDFHLEFAPSSTVTALRMRHVQRIHGWGPWEYPLKPEINASGMIEFGPPVSGALPGGYYWIRPRLEDLIVNGGKRQALAIKEGSIADVVLDAKDDPRRVEIMKPLAEWDKEISRVVRSAQSLIDGDRADQWLGREEPRARRKACFLNLLASLRFRQGGNSSLLSSVLNVFHIEVDRIYAVVTAGLYETLLSLSEDPKQPFYNEGEPTALVHRRLLEKAGERFGLDASAYSLQSFRAEGRPSLQINVAIPPGVAAEHFAEMDLDLGNPLQDAHGFVTHIGELLDSGRTDHLSLRTRLGKTGARDFLYYRVKKS